MCFDMKEKLKQTCTFPDHIQFRLEETIMLDVAPVRQHAEKETKIAIVDVEDVT
jgi:hypothetical protein